VTFLSNNPAHSTAILPETARSLLATGRFAGVEDASGDPQTFSCMQAVAGRTARILAGDDLFLADAVRASAHGVISGAAGAVPELVTALERAIRTGNQSEADRLERRMGEFLAWRHEFPEPAILKIAVELRGIKTGGLSVPLSSSRQKRLQEFREWFPRWLKG
jgi:dihydrodipicolinate synthase/N-acetylneuraminate lyase